MKSNTKTIYSLAALVAWVGTLLSLIATAFNISPSKDVYPHLFGTYPSGAISIIPRTFDWLCYFTEWSNIAMAISFTLIARNGFTNKNRDKFIHHISLVMMTVTLIVNYFLLASKEHPQGINVISNLLEHYLTPLVGILLFIFIYPRKEWKFKTTSEVFYVAIAYIALTFIKGAITHRYPYGFMDVVQYGYIKVLITTVFILIFAWILGLIFFGIDKVLPGKK